MDAGQLNSLIGLSHDIDQFGIMKGYDSNKKGKKKMAKAPKKPAKPAMPPKKGPKKGC